MTVNPTGPDSPANVKLTSAEMIARSEEMLDQAYRRFKEGEGLLLPPDGAEIAATIGQGYALLAVAKLKAGPPR